MFGMGGSEIVVILIVALLFLGPDKLPGAAKSLSKGIRDLKKQSRSLQQQIESDEQIGGAIRDLKSALRGEELPVQRSIPPPKRNLEASNTIHDPLKQAPPAEEVPVATTEGSTEAAPAALPAPEERVIPKVTLPETAGEAGGPRPADDEDAELAAMIKPAPGTVAKGS